MQWNYFGVKAYVTQLFEGPFTHEIIDLSFNVFRLPFNCFFVRRPN